MSDQRTRLYVDMDGTLAEFRPVNRLETLYEWGYFVDLQPNPNVVEAVRQIIREHPEVEVNVLSAYLSDSNFALQEKNDWLDRYLPEIREEHRIFLPCGTDKKQYIPGGIRSTDVLLDDYTLNLSQWEPPARGLKLLNGINHTKKTWQGDRIRFDREPSEMVENILAVVGGSKHLYDDLPDKNQDPRPPQEVLMKNTVVVNAFGGPGAGKTTACFDIVSEFKKRGFVADYVPEYATELVWDNNLSMLDGTEEHQRLLLAEQKHRIDRLIGKVDFVVTDSPLLLNITYNKQLTPEYEKTVRDYFGQYNNFTFVIERDDSKFTEKGRIHNLSESKEKDKEIRQMLSSFGIYYGTYRHDTVGKIIDNAIVTLRRTESGAFEQRIDSPSDPGKPQPVIQGTIKFYDSKTQARRLLLVIGQTENQELVCLGITSANPNKDHEKYVSTVPLPKATKNRLKYDIYVKCDVEYIIAQDSLYADIAPMPPRISNAEYNKVMAVYESLKRQSLVKRVQNTVEPKKDEFEKLRKKVIQEVENYKRDPKVVAELVEFRARFYNYSINNVLLIRAQNRAATFVASYKDWKKHGYNVNRGEKGIKILVPYEVTYYRGKNGEWENVRTAPREILDKVYQGQIETRKQTYFTVGHVFDISQTTCPPADYPKFYDMGYESAGHAAVYECVKAFAERSGFQVIEDAISSIALKGFYKPADDTITINSRLADSEKLATITHEFAHALMHKTSTQPIAVVEFEAECLSHMILSRFGFPTSDVNKDYLATYYSKIKADELQLEKNFQRISKAYNHAVDGIDRTLAGRGIEIGLERQQKRQNERFVAPAEQVTQNFLQDIE